MRQTKGFSLLELLVTLGIITVLATVAVPRVNVWIARNRGLQVIIELLSDFSKAKSVAVSTVIQNNTGDSEGAININGSEVNLGTRPTVAMFFWKDGYQFLQKNGSVDVSYNWADADVLRARMMPAGDNVAIVKIGDGADSTVGDIKMASGFSNAKYITFTSTGFVKRLDGKIIEGNGSHECGGKSLHIPNPVFSAVVKSDISGTDGAICYQVVVNDDGRYGMCMSFSDTGACSNDTVVFQDNRAMIIEM